jgi:hypothetical protein
MQQWERDAAVVARDLIADLQQSIQAWMDADRILPADGAALLAALDQVLLGQDRTSASSTQDRIEAFIFRGQELIASGVLGATDGRPQRELAAAMGALLRCADGAGSEGRVPQDEVPERRRR